MRRVSGKKTQATHMPKSAITISDDGSLVRKRMLSGLFTFHKPQVRSKDLAEDRRGNILEIPVDDAMVVQVLHAGQDGTRDKMKRISLSLLSPAEEQSNVPSTATVSRSEKRPRRLRDSKSPPLTASSKAR